MYRAGRPWLTLFGPERAVDFRVLGLLEVADAGRAVELRGKKVRTLLAMLALHPGTVVSSERLIEALWDDHPPPTAMATLQVHVSHLRKALGPHLIQTRCPGYVLDVAPDQIDAIRFERMVDEGRVLVASDPNAAVAHLTEALGLWRGPALADFCFDNFARVQVARLDELRLVAVEERTEAQLALGRDGELVGASPLPGGRTPTARAAVGPADPRPVPGGTPGRGAAGLHRDPPSVGRGAGIEPGPALRQLEADVLAQHPRLEVTATEATAARTDDSGAAIPLFAGRRRSRTAVDGVRDRTGGLRSREIAQPRTPEA